MTSWLIVHGDQLMMDFIEACLEVWNIEGILFLGRDETIEWIHVVDAGLYDGELPQIALLDTQMRGSATAVEVGACIRQSAKLQYMPIILTTYRRLTMQQEDALMHQVQADHVITGHWLNMKLPERVDRTVTRKILDG